MIIVASFTLNVHDYKHNLWWAPWSWSTLGILVEKLDSTNFCFRHVVHDNKVTRNYGVNQFQSKRWANNLDQRHWIKEKELNKRRRLLNLRNNHSEKRQHDGMFERNKSEDGKHVKKGNVDVSSIRVSCLSGTPMRMLAIPSNPTRAPTPAPSSLSPPPPSSTGRPWPGTRWRGGRRRRRWRGSEATSAPRPSPPLSSKPSCRKYPDWTETSPWKASKWINSSPLGVWKLPPPRGRTGEH